MHATFLLSSRSPLLALMVTRSPLPFHLAFWSGMLLGVLQAVSLRLALD